MELFIFYRNCLNLWYKNNRLGLFWDFGKLYSHNTNDLINLSWWIEPKNTLVTLYFCTFAQNTHLHLQHKIALCKYLFKNSIDWSKKCTFKEQFEKRRNQGILSKSMDAKRLVERKTKIFKSKLLASLFQPIFSMNFLFSRLDTSKIDFLHYFFLFLFTVF